MTIDTGDNVEQRNAAGRTPEHEQMVRFGYYAGMVAAQWDRHPSAALLAEDGYDVAAVMDEMSKWAYARAGEYQAALQADSGSTAESK